MQTPSQGPSTTSGPARVEPQPPQNESESRPVGVPRRKGRGPGKKPLTEAALAARRANLAKARAADKDLIYRPTERRRAASRANIQKAIAWRRSPEGNTRARLNALQHGLAVEQLPDILDRLGEGPEDFAHHRQMVRRVFLPETDAEWVLVERLARETWRRLRLLRARVRLETRVWRRWVMSPAKTPKLSLEDTIVRARSVERRLEQAHRVEDESYTLESRIERILESLIRERAKE